MGDGNGTALWFGAPEFEVLAVRTMAPSWVMASARRRRRRQLVTAAVDVTTGRVIDVFEGHDAADLRA